MIHGVIFQLLGFLLETKFLSQPLFFHKPLLLPLIPETAD